MCVSPISVSLIQQRSFVCSWRCKQRQVCTNTEYTSYRFPCCSHAFTLIKHYLEPTPSLTHKEMLRVMREKKVLKSCVLSIVGPGSCSQGTPYPTLLDLLHTVYDKQMWPSLHLNFFQCSCSTHWTHKDSCVCVCARTYGWAVPVFSVKKKRKKWTGRASLPQIISPVHQN